MKNSTILKIVISLVAVAAIVTHLVFPNLKIDGITLGLMVLAFLPWASALIESAKFPGGWEVKFRDLEKAASKVTAGHESAQPTVQETESFSAIARIEPNLALVYLRIEIEKKFRKFGELNGLNERLPLTQLIRQAVLRQVLSPLTEEGLKTLITAGNNAAHGATVDERVRDWCIAEGPIILAALDAQLIPIEKIIQPKD